MEHHRTTGHQFLRTEALPLEKNETLERRYSLTAWLKNCLHVILDAGTFTWTVK